MELGRSVSVTTWVLSWRQVFDLQERKGFACTSSVQIGSRAIQTAAQRVLEGVIEANRRLVHLRPSRINVKNAWSYVFTRPYVFTLWYSNTKGSFSSPYTSFTPIINALNTFPLIRHISFFHPSSISSSKFFFIQLSFPYTIFFPLFMTKVTIVTFQAIQECLSVSLSFSLWPRVVCYISISPMQKNFACICIVSSYQSNNMASHPVERRLITIFLFDLRSK